MACLSEVSEKRATEWSENSIAFGSIRKPTAKKSENGMPYGSIRKTDHTAADGNAYLRVESSTVFASRFAEAREVIAYAANNTASQITPAMSAMR